MYASTFTGNTAKDHGGAIGSGLGSCPAEGLEGGGSVTVTASTFGSNTDASGGGTIDNAEQGRVTAAADVIDGSCTQLGGTWDDQGYNAGSDASCFAAPAPASDVDAGSAAALALDPLAANGGPTQTVMPQPGSPVIGIIPSDTLVTLPGGTQFVCPVNDQRGYYTSPPGACDAGAVQTTGQAPLKLADSTPAPGFRQAGDQITYHYKVTNTDNNTLTGIAIDDPAVPGAICPRSSLAPGKAETCTGSYTVTAADVAAGKVTDTATATATSVFSGLVISNSSTVTVRELWPATVTGSYQPPAGAAEGYYLGVTGSTWTLLVTHPGTGKVPFAGKITINTGTITSLTPISLGTGDGTHVNGKTLTFTITSHGQVNGFRFTAKLVDLDHLHPERARPGRHFRPDLPRRHPHPVRQPQPARFHPLTGQPRPPATRRAAGLTQRSQAGGQREQARADHETEKAAAPIILICIRHGLPPHAHVGVQNGGDVRSAEPGTDYSSCCQRS